MHGSSADHEATRGEDRHDTRRIASQALAEGTPIDCFGPPNATCPEQTAALDATPHRDAPAAPWLDAQFDLRDLVPTGINDSGPWQRMDFARSALFGQPHFAGRIELLRESWPLQASIGAGDKEKVRGITGTSDDDVYVWTTERLLRWNGRAPVPIRGMGPPCSFDPIDHVGLSRKGHVWALSAGGRMFQVVGDALVARDRVPGPVVAPPHPFVDVLRSESDGAGSLWGAGVVRTAWPFIPAIVRWNGGKYTTWIGRVTTPSLFARVRGIGTVSDIALEDGPGRPPHVVWDGDSAPRLTAALPGIESGGFSHAQGELTDAWALSGPRARRYRLVSPRGAAIVRAVTLDTRGDVWFCTYKEVGRIIGERVEVVAVLSDSLDKAGSVYLFDSGDGDVWLPVQTAWNDHFDWRPRGRFAGGQWRPFSSDLPLVRLARTAPRYEWIGDDRGFLTARFEP